MNNGGITSIPVLDQQNNVIGNISQVDVRVSSGRPTALTGVTLTEPLVTDQVDLTPPSPLLLHPLYLRHPLRTRGERWQRFVPRLPRQSIQYSCARRGQINRHSLPSIVGCRGAFPSLIQSSDPSCRRIPPAVPCGTNTAPSCTFGHASLCQQQRHDEPSVGFATPIAVHCPAWRISLWSVIRSCLLNRCTQSVRQSKRTEPSRP